MTEKLSHNGSKMIFYKVFGIICFSSLPFIFSLNGEFVFDDSLAVLENKDVTSNSWLKPFRNDYWGTNIKNILSHKSYRPLTIISFKLNYVFNGKKLSATHFKVINLICHVISSLLSWAVFDAILRDSTRKQCFKWKNMAYQSSLLFAVHPIHVEAVSGIVGRADILAAITFFLTFLFYRNAMRSPYLAPIYLSMTSLLAGISMLFKENGITVLGFCIMYEIINLLKHKTFNNNIVVKSSVRILFIVIFTLVLLYARWTLMGGTKPLFKQSDNPAYFSDNLLTKVLTYNYIYFMNLLLLVWPYWLCYDWSMGCIPLLKDICDYRIIFIIIMYLYAIMVVLKLSNTKVSATHKRIMSIACLLLAIPFLPAANIFFPVGFVIAERILYIPTAGYCLLLVLGLRNIHHLQFARRLNASFVFWFILTFYLLRSWQRAYDWQTEYKLFNSAQNVCPLNAKVHYNIAKVAAAASQQQCALDEYKEAIRLHPEYSEAMNNLGNLLKDSNYLIEAEFYFRKALQYKPESAATWMNLGIVLARLRRYNESESSYRSALRYRKNYPMCYYNLGNMYLEKNKTNEAMEAWLHAIKLNSTHVLAWTNLLALLDNTDQLEKAMELIPLALSALPESAAVNFAIANIYGKQDMFVEAEKYFRKSIQLFGTPQAIHYSNLGVLYHRWKKFDLAAEMYEEALRVDPTFESARRNLRRLKKV